MTGAADAAAPFARAGWDARVVLGVEGLTEPRDGTAVALDAASRSGSLAALGPAAVAAVARHLGAAGVAFLKIDSLLRGHVAADVAALAGGRRRVAIAPAFPGQGRTMTGGAVHVHGRPAGGEPLAARLERRGLTPVAVARGAELPQSGVLVIDAETDADLTRVAGAGGETLWVGSAGLAAALAARHAPPAHEVVPPAHDASSAGAVLTIVGSRTALARRQVEAAVRRGVEVVPPSGVVAALAAGRHPIVAAGDGGGPDDVRVVRDLAAALGPLDGRVGALVLVGGDTARAVLEAAGLSELRVVGELEPGVAACADGNGRRVVTKSGSFGDDGCLARIHARLGVP